MSELLCDIMICMKNISDHKEKAKGHGGPSASMSLYWRVELFHISFFKSYRIAKTLFQELEIFTGESQMSQIKTQSFQKTLEWFKHLDLISKVE